MKLIAIFCCLWVGMTGQVWGQFSEEFKNESPIWTIGEGDHELALYGYKGDKLENGVIRGEIQPDSSVFLSGFVVMNGREMLFERTENSFYQLRKNRDSLYVDLILNLPVGKNRNWQYVPVLRYVIFFKDGHGKVAKPQNILDMSQLTQQDFWKMKKDLGWDGLQPEILFPRNNAYPELRLTNAFLVCLKYFPTYNSSYSKLEKGDGALREIFGEYAKILRELE